jgi:Tfp pilus assembly pilus retraction ATPase PilT
MSLLPSLCAALERAGGQRLVMRAGERPHVLAGERRHDVATAVLSVNAVEALIDQILSSDSRRLLADRGSVEETLNTPAFPQPLTARAERVGDDFCVELIVRTAEPEPAPEPPPLPVIEPEPERVAVAEDASVAEVVLDEAPAPRPVVIETFQPTVVSIPPVAKHVEPEIEPHPPVRVVTRVEEPMYKPAATARVVNGQTDLHGWIAFAFERGAATLFLRAGAPPSGRINERIAAISDEIVGPSVFEEIAAFTTRGGDALWRSVSEGEWARDHEDFGHVTCRLFDDDQGQGVVVHLLPRVTPKLLHKYIPRQVRTACEAEGLVIVSAQTEADVASLAAATADWSGRARGGYLIALQRRGARAELAGAFVSQRTVGGSDAEFATAIRRAANEGPDTLLVLGPRTDSVLHEAVLAASSGRLVIVGVVAPTGVHALQTMLGHSGLDRDAHVRRALASSFRVAVGYRSLRRLGGGRMLIQDIVTTSKDVRALIEAADFDGLTALIHRGMPGARSVDEALARATRRRQVSLREAAAHADDRSRLVALVRTRARAESVSGRRTAREIHVPLTFDDRSSGRAVGGKRASRA